MTNIKVGYIGGFWATNIGNSFYNIGALFLLRKIYGDENVFFIPDPPQWHWNGVDNDYKLLSNLDLDLFIVSGPCLNAGLIKVYKGIFDDLKSKGKKIAFVSAGASNYDDKEVIVVAEFLNNYDVQFLATRDELTYNLYKNHLKTNVYNGVCTSMFLNDAVDIPVIDDDYVVFNFSTFREPRIRLVDDHVEVKNSFLPHFQGLFEGSKIVRTNNQPFTRNAMLLNTRLYTFNKPLTYYSDLPYGYLSILKSAKYVFSDRVHTCAASLIFGNKTMYIKNGKRSHDNRNKLFSRIGLPEIYSGPVILDQKYIKSEKENLQTFITNSEYDI